MTTISYLGKSGATVNVDVADNDEGKNDNSKALYEAGYRNGRIDPNNLQSIGVGQHRLYKDAAQAFIQMAKAYYDIKKKPLTVTDSYRPLQVQIDLILKKGYYKGEAPVNTSQTSGLAAQPGTSNHGWGLAVDIAGADTFDSDTYKWLATNAENFGFQRIKDDTKEPWHWEYTKYKLNPVAKVNTPPTPATAPTPTPTATTSTDTDGIDNYITTTYQNAYKSDPNLLNAYNTTLQPELFKIRDVMLTKEKMDTERKFVQELEKLKTKRSGQIATATKNLSSFTANAQKVLVLNDLYALNPDDMRSKMFKNSQMYDPKIGPEAAHAWRAPGKLSVSANITIPGMSGFRIAQIFWIDRIPEYYKTYGAFQLFGLKETIDINKGWTTELYARFNAIPQQHISRLYDYQIQRLATVNVGG